jgi:two-component system LytT family response regulator
MRVLIADDEAPARDRLRQLLAAHSHFEIVAEAESGEEAIQLAESAKPELLLLDIQMPKGSGLDVAACLPSPRPAIIFCTAYDQHAVDAFELNAIDYLLKPVSRARLAQSLDRLGSRMTQDSEGRLDRILHSRGGLTRFLVRRASHYLVVPAASAEYFESVDGLTRLVTGSGQSHWIDPSLQDLEERMDSRIFFRISRSAVVNLSAVIELHPLPGGSAEVLLKGGARIEVSRRRTRDLLKALENVSSAWF